MGPPSLRGGPPAWIAIRCTAYDGPSCAPGCTAKSAKKRMLIIVNPYATTVSDRLRNLVVYALQGRYEVEAVSTEAQNHATEIGREVRDHGYDVVVAFGGDGTLNEVANGLAGTDLPVAMLPGGSTNVVCRTPRHPQRRRRRDRAPALAGRRVGAAQDRPRQGRRAPLRLRLRGRDRRDGGPAGRRTPEAEGQGRPLLLQLGRRLGLLPPATCSTPVRMRVEVDGRRAGRGRHRDRPELRPVHLLRQPTDPGLRGDRDRRRHALDRRPQARRPARHADPDRRASSAQNQPAAAPPPGRRTSTTSPSATVDARSPRTRTAPHAPSRSRSTATTSATAPGSSCAPSPAR